MGKFSFMQFLGRWIAALVLVVTTYNPGGWSYVDWIREQGMDDMPALKVLVGLLIFAGYAVFVGATWRGLGLFGTAITVALLGTMAWLLVDLGWLDPQNREVVIWTVLVIAATVLAVGLSWSHVSRRLSGQIDVDETDE